MDNAVMVVAKLSDFSIESIVEEIIFSISTVFKNSSNFFKQSPPSSREIITQERKEEMIKSKRGVTELSGTDMELRADFCVIVSSVKDYMMKDGATEDEVKKEILEYVEKAFTSHDENEKKVKEEFEKTFGKSAGAILALLALKGIASGNADE